jgi:DNA replication and repair protein RecF
MSLAELRIDDVRCIEHAELRLHAGHNLIWGGNGSGKTSLLESIFLLGRGRSFRTRSSERLIRHGEDRLVVFGRTRAGGVRELAERHEDRGGDRAARSGVSIGLDQVFGVEDSGAVGGRFLMNDPREPGEGRSAGTDSGGPGGGRIAGPDSRQSGGTRIAGADPQGAGGEWVGGADAGQIGAAGVGGGNLREPGRWDGSPGQAMGVQVSRADGTVARINGTTAGSLTELTQVFPVQVIDPGIHKLVEEGGHRRRRWMDWGVFHVEHQFGDWWLRYTRAIKQRNAALRTQPAQAPVWDVELARLGELIADARRRYVEALLPYWRESVLALSDLEPELHYFKGWAQDVTLAEALVASKARDEVRRVTHPGPHRADIVVRLNGRPAREVLSRGQQKLVAVAMTLGQLNLLLDTTQTTPTLLLDDPAAELDGPHLRRFIEQVMRLRSQLVLTSLHPESQLFGVPDCVFHVEQGRVQPV